MCPKEFRLKRKIQFVFKFNVVTEGRNDLQPPTTTQSHLKKFNNHLQPPQKHLQPPTSISEYNLKQQTSEMTICSSNSRSEENLNFPLQSYSPRSPCIINYCLKSRNEMCDHSIYILYSHSSKERTLCNQV